MRAVLITIAAMTMAWTAITAARDLFLGASTPAKAAAVVPDPWANSSIEVLGSKDLPGGGTISAVRIPDWPSPALCIALTGPRGTALRCDGDFPANQPSAPNQ